MSTTTSSSSSYDYDLVVIGGGSGGVSTAKRASTLYNKKVAVIEGARMGGTCVNVGCVPKKIWYQTAAIYETVLHDSKHYRISTGNNDEHAAIKFDWTSLKDKRDKYIQRLNGIYQSGLVSANVTILTGWGTFLDNHTIAIKDTNGTTTSTITAEHIVIAVGGKPETVSDVPGIEHTITSDGFFELDIQPKKAVVVGAGYIAVELAGVLAALGTETHLIVRKQTAIRTFDPDIVNFLDDIMSNKTPNLTIHRNTEGLASVTFDTTTGTKSVTTIQGNVSINDLDIVLMAAGRSPNIDGLGLETLGVKLNGKKEIIVNDYQTTSIDNIYAVGDVCDKGYELTPVAIAAGRRLADRLFSNHPSLHGVAKISYDNIPTVVFSHPPIGTIGLTEPQASAKYGSDNIKVYRSTFVNLYYSMWDTEPSDKPKTFVKLICYGPTEIIVGLHIIGMAADEILQGFGVAINMNATKADFDNCIAIHPTAAEEVVTIGTWGTSPIPTDFFGSTTPTPTPNLRGGATTGESKM